jgi:hypothetical protein
MVVYAVALGIVAVIFITSVIASKRATRRARDAASRGQVSLSSRKRHLAKRLLIMPPVAVAMPFTFVISDATWYVVAVLVVALSLVVVSVLSGFELRELSRSCDDEK